MLVAIEMVLRYHYAKKKTVTVKTSLQNIGLPSCSTVRCEDLRGQMTITYVEHAKRKTVTANTTVESIEAAKRKTKTSVKSVVKYWQCQGNPQWIVEEEETELPLPPPSITCFYTV